MNAPIKDFVDADTRQNMLTTLQAQRDSYIAEGSYLPKSALTVLIARLIFW